MFERFTEEARQVVVCAQEEARALNHSYIGTEHILLGLLRAEEETSTGERPLQGLGIELEQARGQVTRIVGRGEEPPTSQIPFTPRAKKVLELALREALSFGHNWIGPEHILLGIARENEGVASRVLLDLDADSERIRNQVIQMLPAPRSPSPGLDPLRHVARVPIDMDWLGGLSPMLAQLSRDIRRQLQRDPDLGDLLLTIACAPDTLAGRALREVGVELDALWGTLERIRQQESEERESLRRRIEALRAEKERAIAGQEFAEAGRLRDEALELSEQTRRLVSVGEVLAEVRRRLGLTSPEE